MKKYQLKYSNSNGIEKTVFDCDKMIEIIDYMYVNVHLGKYLRKY